MSNNAINLTASGATAISAPSSPGNGQRAWRLLQIEKNLDEALQIELMLREELSAECKIDHAKTLADAADRLIHGKYDAVLFSVSADNDSAICWGPLRELTELQPETPVLVIFDNGTSKPNTTDMLLEAGSARCERILS